MQWGGQAGGWNDNSGLANAALAALKAAAGIELPSRKTIFYLLAGYLACLVPLNWLLFRLIWPSRIRLDRSALSWPSLVSLSLRKSQDWTLVSHDGQLKLQYSSCKAHMIEPTSRSISHSTPHFRPITAWSFPRTTVSLYPSAIFPRPKSVLGASKENSQPIMVAPEGVQLEPLTVYSNSTEMVHSEQIISLDWLAEPRVRWRFG